jgi:hypothetical protein
MYFSFINFIYLKGVTLSRLARPELVEGKGDT